MSVQWSKPDGRAVIPVDVLVSIARWSVPAHAVEQSIECRVAILLVCMWLAGWRLEVRSCAAEEGLAT